MLDGPQRVPLGAVRRGQSRCPGQWPPVTADKAAVTWAVTARAEAEGRRGCSLNKYAVKTTDRAAKLSEIKGDCAASILLSYSRGRELTRQGPGLQPGA